MILNLKSALEIVKRAGCDTRDTINTSDREQRLRRAEEAPVIGEQEETASVHTLSEELAQEELYDVENL